MFLRQRNGDWEVIGWADVFDLGFFIPDVVIPVVAMFLGVYALGVTIIGYQYASVKRLNRSLYAVASILLMVPEIPLLLAEALFTFAGIPSDLLIFSITVTLRTIGLVMLVALTHQNRSRGKTLEATPETK